MTEMPSGLSQRQSDPAWGLKSASIDDSAESQASIIRRLGPTDRTQESEPPNVGAKPLGGSGNVPPILAHLGLRSTWTKPAASRVSFSDLLCAPRIPARQGAADPRRDGHEPPRLR